MVLLREVLRTFVWAIILIFIRESGRFGQRREEDEIGGLGDGDRVSKKGPSCISKHLEIVTYWHSRHKGYVRRDILT